MSWLTLKERLRSRRTKGSLCSSSSGITTSLFLDFPKQPRFRFSFRFSCSRFTDAYNSRFSSSPTSLQKKLPLEMEIPFFLRFLFVGLSISSANRNRSTRLKETEHSEMSTIVCERKREQEVRQESW